MDDLEDRAEEELGADPDARRHETTTPVPEMASESHTTQGNLRGILTEWVHDRYNDEDETRRPGRREDYGRRSPSPDRRRAPPSDVAKLRVENLHFELLEPDIRELFQRIGNVISVQLLYDRHDRTTGTAFVTYSSVADARRAVREFDGANAYGQPIRVTLLPPQEARPRNPFDNVEKPSRSLFERINTGSEDRSPERRDRARGRGRRSESPRARREEIDRYVPGSRNRERSPIRSRRGTPRESGRRPGERGGGRGGRGGRRTDGDGRPLVGGRPRKTQEELDAEMNDYWGAKGNDEQNGQKEQNGEQGGAQDVEIDLMVE
ncbi:hypothetical protein BDZ85DRAFT_128169 [Elsinoe ampelina]|uniref:RRM domain-containing protein n=1 Tax=Elsinoe ampelina TaxID=302913 RepID=A0A6A6GA24_9PEZI|nr:hypothetical protein BDZ85DRAFT_128169 [Elsinoe ampelina]